MRFRVVQKHGSRTLAIINLVLRVFQLVFAFVVLVDWSLLAVKIDWRDLAGYESSQINGKLMLQLFQGLLFAMPSTSILTAIIFMLIPMLAGYRYVALSAPWELLVVLGWSATFTTVKLGIITRDPSKQADVIDFHQWFCSPFMRLHSRCWIDTAFVSQAWNLVWLVLANLTVWLLSLLLDFSASVYICVIEQDTVCTI